MKKILFLLPLILALLVSGTVEAKKKKYPNGDYYEGKWKKGNPNGIGIMKYFNGDLYEGEWKDGEKTGTGKMIYNNGNIYIGAWNNNVYHGQGKLSKTDGEVLEGIWRNGVFYNGRKTTPEGNIEDGLWENEMMYDGIFKGYLYGAYYKGRFNVKFLDKIINVSATDSLWFDGEIKEGKLYSGLCKGYLTDSFWCDGILNYGNLSKVICKGYIGDNYYDGKCEGNFFIGNCKLYSVDKNLMQFEGFISEDLSKSGVFIFKDGSKYTGKLKHNKRIGNGCLSMGNITICGDWSYDILKKGEGNIKMTDSGLYFSFVLNRVDDMYYELVVKNDIGKEIKTTFSTHFPSKYELFAQVSKASGKLFYQMSKEEKIANEKRRNEFIAKKTLAFDINSYLWTTSDIVRLKQQNIAKFNNVLSKGKLILYGTIVDIFKKEVDNSAAYYWSDGILPTSYFQYFIELYGGVIIPVKRTDISNMNKGDRVFVLSELINDDYQGYVVFNSEIIKRNLLEIKNKLCTPVGTDIHPIFEYEKMKLIKNIY